MTNSDDAPQVETIPEAAPEKASLFTRLGGYFRKMHEGEQVTPGTEPLVVDGAVHIAWENGPFALTLGDVTLELHPDVPISGDSEGVVTKDWLVHGGSKFYETVPRFIRIEPGASHIIGRTRGVQKNMFGFDKTVAARHVELLNVKGNLIIRPLERERETVVTSIDVTTEQSALWAHRRHNLLRLPELLGRPLICYDDGDEALEAIREVNTILAKEAYRDRDDEGAPGGIITFPDDMTVIVMGDVHTRIDNVLRVLTEGGVLAAIERKDASLVFLGDLVHSEEDGELEDMESTIFILDVFMMLKRRFPKNVFYIRGNHESFSPEVGKGGVPQGILMQKKVKARRGKAYMNELEKMFESLAFVVQGKEFAGAHGAPVRSQVSRAALVNIQRYPGIQGELVWNRLRQGNRPAGYGKGSVKRFRQTLDLPKHATMIVAHTPLSTDKTVWFDVGGITGHHVIYSAYKDKAAAIIIEDGVAVAQEYVPENALSYLNGEMIES